VRGGTLVASGKGESETVTLRRKILLIIGATLIALILGFFAISSTILLRGFDRLERQEARENVQRVLNAFSDELANLSAKGADWSAWDDSYAFVQNRNRKFIQSNCGPTAFTDLRLNLMVFVDTGDHIVYQRGFDLRSGEDEPVPESLVRTVFAGERHLLRHAGVNSVKAGVVLLPEGPLLLVSQPIVTSERKGPIRGTLLFGRKLDEAEVARIAHRLHLTLAVYRVDGPELPADVQAARSLLAASASAEPICTRPLDDQWLAGYSVWKDLRGQPALLFRVELPREVHAQGQVTRSYILIALLAVGVVFGCVTILLLERLVLTRMVRLVAGVNRIGTRADPSARVDVNGGDELAGLSRAINSMLDGLEKSHQQLQESQRTLATLMSNLPGLVCRCRNDRNRTVEFVSDGCLPLTGYQPGDLVDNKTIAYGDLIHPDDRESVWSDVQQALQEGKAFQLAYRIKTASGEEKWVWEQGRGVYSAQGELLALEGFVFDISQRKRAEEQFRQAEARYRTVVEQLPAITYIAEFGADGRWLYVSPQIESLLGFSPDEWTARPHLWYEQLHPDDRDRVLAEETLSRETGTPVTHEYRMLTRNGDVIWFNDRAVVVRDTAGQMQSLHGVMFDITERKRLEEQVLQSQKVEAVGRLAGGVAHDFNNILTTITGYSELMLMKIPRNDPLRKNAEEIQRAADKAASLTRQLLAFSRKQTLQPRVLELSGVVADIEKMLRRLIGEDVELHTIHGAAVGRVKADPAQISQVIMNLAVNARDAMPTGGCLTIGVANARLDADYARRHDGVAPGEYVLLSVSDTGIGMSPEVQAHLFEPFFTTKPLGEGTGLGLATCYGIIQQSDGHITVYSEPGKGTTFRIYLPRVAEAVEPLEPRADGPELPTGSETVLVAEDEPAVREFAAGMLRDLGYTVLEAANGEEGQRVVRQHADVKIDLVFTDVVMPQMGGKQFADWINVERPGTKVLFSSGYTADAIVRHGVLEDRIAFLEKPFTPTSLARKVREVLDRN